MSTYKTVTHEFTSAVLPWTPGIWVAGLQDRDYKCVCVWVPARSGFALKYINAGCVSLTHVNPELTHMKVS